MVKCSECGRLGVIDEYDGVLREADSARRTGMQQSSKGNSTRAKVVCYAGIRQPTEMQKESAAETVTSINLDFECASFVKWAQGRTPKDVENMEIKAQLLALQQSMVAIQIAMHDFTKEQAAAAKEQAEKYRQWEMQIQALGQVRHNEMISVGKSQAKGSNWQAVGTILAVVVSVISMIVSLVGVIPR